MLHENHCCFNAIIRIMWKEIQQQLYLKNFGIDIGQFNKSNMSVIFSKFKNMIMNYLMILILIKQITLKKSFTKFL
jgi:hypothetical protein